ncbi:MAG: hypothetical protein J7L20_04220 [Thermoplasmata archaeon]|nr:hypothetical protein [Thermoplasmata archaeon]
MNGTEIAIRKRIQKPESLGIIIGIQSYNKLQGGRLGIVVKSVEELSNIHGGIENSKGVKRTCTSVVLDILN